MKKAVALILLLCLLCSCGNTYPESNDFGSESSLIEVSEEKPETEIVYNASFPAYGVEPSCSLKFGEISVHSYFSSVIELFYYSNVDIDADSPISAEFAYKCFDASFRGNYFKIDNFDELVQETDDVYTQYYPKELVESYVSAQFGVSPDELKELEEYDSENSRYLNNYYGGAGKGSVTILEQELKDGVYIADFVFDGALHQTEPIYGHMELKYVDDHFELASLNKKR